MEAYLQVWPAYGRRYAIGSQAKSAFLEGKDFSCSRVGGPYTSVRDFKEAAPALTHFKGVRIVQVVPHVDIFVKREEMK